MESILLEKPEVKTFERTSSFSAYSKLLLFSSLSILVGVLWDISWHMSIGRDTLLSPPHIAIYLGGILAGISSFYKTIQISFFSGEEEKSKCVKFWGLHAPLGALFCIWGSGAMLTSAPFDDWWHNAYGLDVKILSPPHALLAIGIFSIQLGSMFSILSLQNNQVNSGFWKYAYVLSAGVFVTIAYVFVIEYMSRSRMHLPLFYQVAGGVLPLVLFSGSAGARVKYPTMMVALVYMFIFLFALWIFPLIPAEPKLSPVRNPVDHFVPLPFPLLLFLPALAVDLVNNRWKNIGFWGRAVASSFVFLTSLFIIQYFFADFLNAPVSRNWFFGSHEWAYYTDPNLPFRYFARPFQGSGQQYAGAMIFAFVLTVFSAALGMRWGRWMQNLRR